MTRAVVLLSGGLDSATTLSLACAQGRDCAALSFDWGQRNRVELECAVVQAKRFGVSRHEVMALPGFGALVAPVSALADGSPHALPQVRQADGIPLTYVPARNTVFLAYAAAFAEVLDALEIWIGVNAMDYSGYPDCRPDFLAAWEPVLRCGTRMGVAGRTITIRAPLLCLHKHEIVELAHSGGVDLASTSSCYDAHRNESGAIVACGRCDSCRIRAAGFAKAGLRDPMA
jgi:7-cyano-7-deazaguanine synthase